MPQARGWRTWFARRLAAGFVCLCLWLAVGMGAAGSAGAQMFYPAGPYIHPESQLVFPDSLGGIPRVSAYDYEPQNPGLGVSIKYAIETPRIFADVYVFKQGLLRIPEGVDDPAVQRMFDSAVADIHTMGAVGRYADVILIATDSITLGESPGARRALRARFAYTLAEGPVYSHVYALAVHNHFVKLRFTYRKDQGEEAVRLLAGFLEGLGAVVGPNLQ